MRTDTGTAAGVEGGGIENPAQRGYGQSGAGASAESGDADDVALDCGTLVDGGGWLGGQWRARPGKKMKTNNMRLCGLDPF